MMKLSAAMDTAPATEAPRKINVVLNWFEELKQWVPVRDLQDFAKFLNHIQSLSHYICLLNPP
jgi:hypothetical protein